MSASRLIAALLSIAKNGVPAFGLLVRDWAAPGALLLYLGENIVLVLLSALAVRLFAPPSKARGDSLRTFFLVAVPFTVGAAVFTFAVILIHTEYSVQPRELLAGFATMLVLQLLSFAMSIRGLRNISQTDGENMLVGVLGRVFLLALAVWIGLIVAFVFTSAFVIPFMVLKTIVDLGRADLMNLKRFVAVIALIASLPLLAADADAKRYGVWGVDLEGMDKSVKPGDDFFRYANGKWAASTQIPPDKTTFGAFTGLRDVSEARVRALLDRWAADKNLKAGSDEAKVAALYRAFLDEAAVEKLDGKPIEPYLDALKKAKTHDDVAKLMGRTNASFGRSLFNAGVSDDAKNPDKYTLYLSQSGIGLPDREFYLRDNFKPQKERYQKYVADMLRLAGWEEPEKNAAGIVAMETMIAEAQWSRAEGRDRDKTYNPTTIAELEKNAPGFPWAVFFKEAGIDKVDRAVVRQNTAFPKLAKIFADTPVATLQAWQAFHIIDDAAPLLSKRFAEANWEFRAKFLRGQQEERPRWKRAVEAAEGAMGEAIGRSYVAEYFPPDSKMKMEKLVADLRAAMKGRIEKLEWMGPETKARALEKLSKFGVKIGYPAKWRDYAKLEVREGDLVGNAERAAKFEWAFDVSRIGKSVDEGEWGMTPQTVNAYYSSVKNEIVFPAAILQPPFFDPKADPAVNYGGIGAVIGHEITHGFDDQGRKSDGTGMLRDWWAEEDAKKFEAQAAKLGAQYEGFKLPQAPDLHIVGKQTMGENIGDLGGILMALDAYRISLNGQPAPVLDGFTGDQRVFLGWAQVWRTMFRDDALRQYITTDSHSPGMVRAFAPLRNIDAWYDAFEVKEGDTNYVKPEERVRIW